MARSSDSPGADLRASRWFAGVNPAALGYTAAMSKKASKKAANHSSKPNEEERSFDERLEELESIAAQLEGGELGLEESLAHYRRGVEMLRGCREELLAVRAQVEELSAHEEGAPTPYAQDPDGPFEA